MKIKLIVGFIFLTFSAKKNYDLLIKNKNSLFSHNSVKNIFYPQQEKHIIQIINQAKKENKKITILGEGKCQGGQTVSDSDFFQVSLQDMNKLIDLDIKNKKVTVQAGMTWLDLQKIISPHRLAVAAMQSYNNFSIGGSLSVNVHGQDLINNPIIKTIESIKIILSSGEIVYASRETNPELFKAAIGGYGLFGIITQVTLRLTDDIILERFSEVIDSKDLTKYFEKNIKNNPVFLYSARFSLGEEDLLDKLLVVYYRQKKTTNNRYFNFNPESYSSSLLNIFLRSIGSLIEKSKVAKNFRFGLEERYFKQEKIISRNNIMSYSIDGLLRDNEFKSYILQEYFIPYENLNEFIRYFKIKIKENSINLLNLTARHVNKDSESILAYAPNDCCALVLYISQPNSDSSYRKTCKFTQSLIDKSLDLQGKYYLPYHLIATQEQFKRSYPNFELFSSLKQRFDPDFLFTNKFFEKYY